jgi:hypothetical protein
VPLGCCGPPIHAVSIFVLYSVQPHGVLTGLCWLQPTGPVPSHAAPLCEGQHNATPRVTQLILEMTWPHRVQRHHVVHTSSGATP